MLKVKTEEKYQPH